MLFQNNYNLYWKENVKTETKYMLQNKPHALSFL